MTQKPCTIAAAFRSVLLYLGSSCSRKSLESGPEMYELINGAELLALMLHTLSVSQGPPRLDSSAALSHLEINKMTMYAREHLRSSHLDVEKKAKNQLTVL